jgi:alanyl-tRNA synthetase
MTTQTSSTGSERLWTSGAITAEYLSFFRSRGHTEAPGSPLAVPGSGTSFIVAGMQQFIPYFRGALPPPAPRITDIQRCLRTPDVEEVGANGRKLTAFHMLGNWSIGDYGKREAIQLAHELLQRFGLDWSRLYVTTYAGDDALGLPADKETVTLWRAIGVPSERIVPLGSEDNLWTMGGPGPCGPCSEIFVDQGEALGCGDSGCRPGCACERFLEIWNLVFIGYDLLPEGTVKPLPMRSVDTGMGLERIAAALQGVPTVFEIDLFAGASQWLDELTPLPTPSPARGGVAQPRDTTSGDDASLESPLPLQRRGPGGEVRARRVILDHTRSALFAMLEGIYPGRDGRESVVRRLIRRAARQGRALGIEGPFLGELVGPLVEAHRELLTDEQRQHAPSIAQMLHDEERRFSRVLSVGLRLLERMTPGENGLVPGEAIFLLEAERGFPADLAGEALSERGLTVDWPSYERAVEQHHTISRASAQRRFGCG